MYNRSRAYNKPFTRQSPGYHEKIISSEAPLLTIGRLKISPRSATLLTFCKDFSSSLLSFRNPLDAMAMKREVARFRSYR